MKFFIKTHKWIGLVASVFIIVFALSGIFLNHRQGIANIDISRSLLPDDYKYKNWNNAAIKGTLKLNNDSIFLYGGSGIWITDSTRSEVKPLTEGMLSGADNRNTVNIIQTARQEIFAITTFDLYQFDRKDKSWSRKTDNMNTDERLADITTKGDSIVVLTRSHAYISTYPYASFEQKEILAPLGYKNEISMFRAMWTLHSGEMFGTVGQLVVDFVGLIFILLCITGIVALFCPHLIRRSKVKNTKKRFTNILKDNLKCHNKIGAWFFAIGLIVILSGIFLRPPAMIFIIRDKMKPLPGMVQNTDNAWFDKLRNIRYDEDLDDWLLYTSEGFYSMPNWTTPPQPLKNVPRISVMGVSVLEKFAPRLWIVGSFNGLYYWDRQTNMSVDVSKMRPIFLNMQQTGDVVEEQRGVIGGIDVSGYSKDFADSEFVFSYSEGVLSVGKANQFASMPEAIKDVGMSLWHVSLEAHVGRIYTPIVNNVMGESLFVLISGIVMLFIYISGYIVYYRKHKRRKKV